MKRNREELTVVDHYTPTSMGDLNHPNATLGVAIESDSPRFRTQDESFTITTEMNAFGLKSGESKEILRLKEAGEVISIEIISDNPFLQVHLELDDYRTNEGGTTAAELLQVGRTEFADMEFSAKKLPSGDYSLTYAPRINTSYSDSFKLKLTNHLTTPEDFIETTLAEAKQLRGSLPLLSTKGHVGGSFVDIPQIAGIDTYVDPGGPTSPLITNALARALDWDLYDNKYSNDVDGGGTLGTDPQTEYKYSTTTREQDKSTLTTLNPYTGEAGRIQLSEGDPQLTEKYVRIVFFPKGTQASTTAGVPLGTDRTNNDQQIAIYAATSLTDSAEDETAVLHWSVGIYDTLPELWIRDGGRFYFPGRVYQAVQYKSGTGTFVGDGSGNGAVILKIHGGLDFVPEPIGIGNFNAEQGNSNHGIGQVTRVGLDDKLRPHIGMIVRSVIVKRKRKRSLV